MPSGTRDVEADLGQAGAEQVAALLEVGAQLAREVRLVLEGVRDGRLERASRR